MEQIAAGVYVETKYESGNVGFVLTQTGVVCIDVPMLPSDVRDWRIQIASVTPKPIITLIQTDYDQIRIVGTCLFKVPLVAHDSTWDKMKMYSSEKMLGQINEMIEQDIGRTNWRARMPDITFSERLILHKGGREIHVIHGGGHSSATCMVFLPQENVILSGDLVFCNQHPTMNYAESKQWLSALNQLRKGPAEVIVPGHGPLCDKQATYPLSEYIRSMRAMVRKSFQSGRSKSETSSAVISEFFDFFPYDENDRDQVRLRIKGGSDRIYDEYRALAKARASKGKSSSRRSRSKKARALSAQKSS
jgi:cyclase